MFLLDEVDKMAADFRGDPSAALLEVLDPEQNHAFLDHYLDTEYDLSRRDVHRHGERAAHDPAGAAQDRMEVIRIPGYTLNEKMAIAQRYLVPKQLKTHGLEADAGARSRPRRIQQVIERYTREAGVRSLEREIASICRKMARRVVQAKATGDGRASAPAIVAELLGVPRFRPRRKSERLPRSASPRAWPGPRWAARCSTIEVGLMPGRGKLTLTGKLGEVMQESAQRGDVLHAAAAPSCSASTRSSTASTTSTSTSPRAPSPRTVLRPASPWPRRSSRCSPRSPVRTDVAMTGEITLRGKVLPDRRHQGEGARRLPRRHHEVIIPKENEKDLAEIPQEVRDVLEVHLVESMDEVLRLALDGSPGFPGGTRMPPPEEAASFPAGELERASTEPPAGSGDPLAH